MKEQIRHYFNRYVPFEEKEVDHFYSHLVSKSFKKHAYLLRPGQVCTSKIFIAKGLTRSFYIDDKGNEKILQFGIENWWISDTESFIKRIPSKQFIQALEDTTILMITREKLEELYVAIPKLERLFRIITEHTLMAIQRKYEFYMKMSSKERYESLIKGIPDITQRVPQYMIASYLEITPEYLSALRKND
ncbi:Crp/Fnr family transcriptional regulator [Fulvivirgaceae bacterium BMA12]|uniref:Crp/Fnr family transcriptional regulator n=1 Tax=Agaribacillus aureus TaxID=3051825 RepID=A0ABT8LCT0_9BACT|nr:Crp/Fnr family transcriptional regulator [Fulvivirgaceae bacterium BMA12]